MRKHIVHAAHTPPRIWDELDAYATQMRIRLEAKCPACDGELKHTHSDVCCDACDAPVSFCQQRHLSDDLDIRLIYIQVKGHEKEIHRLNLYCLFRFGTQSIISLLRSLYRHIKVSERT